MVIDPLAMAKSGGPLQRAVVGRLIDMAKENGVTVVVTSLIEGNVLKLKPPSSDLNDRRCVLHLSYLVRSGERNRALTIVKSRGTRPEPGARPP